MISPKNQTTNNKGTTNGNLNPGISPNTLNSVTYLQSHNPPSFNTNPTFSLNKTKKKRNSSVGPIKNQDQKRKSASLEESSLPLLPTALTTTSSFESGYENIVNNNGGASAASFNDNDKNNSNAPQYQSCDRCRSKKIKCTYEKHSLNQCLSCKSASLECKNNDKLLRRSSPRGYTELLEETCRNLEIEIKRLKAMYETSKFQNFNHPSIEMPKVNALQNNNINNQETEVSPNHLETGQFKVAVKSDFTTEEEQSISNLKRESKMTQEPNSLYQNQPVLDIKEPPGLTASKIIQNNQNSKGPFQNITLLVSLASPRSTMEVLFSTQLIAKIGLTFGFLNRECLYTSKLLSSLKDDFERLDEKNESFCVVGKLLNQNVDLKDINDFIGLFEFFFTIDNKLLSFQEIENLVNIYFDNWSTIVPIFLKLEFLKTFKKFQADYLKYKQNSSDNSFGNRDTLTPINYKLFMCKLLVMIQMGLSSKNKPSHQLQNLIKLLIKNPIFHANNTSISSLQFLTLALHLFSSTSTQEQILYHLRSLNCMMVQQLRLHRCPQSIVNAQGQQSNIVHRRTRRLLFWSNYILDCLVSFQLGVPRLIKDDDSEVMLPFDEPLLEGVDAKVEPVGLQILKLGLIFGGVLDGLFKSFNKFEKANELLKQEFSLENWYNNLPEQLSFEINAEGNINLELLEIDLLETKDYGKFNLMFVYFFVKSMIHLTLVSVGGEFGKDFNTVDNNLEVGGGMIPPSKVDSYIKLHQYSEVLLHLISISYKLNYKIALPFFIPNLVVKFSLLGLERTLEYKKSCELFLQYRKLIETLVDQMTSFKKLDCKSVHGAVGSLSWYSIKLFDITLSLLLLVNTKESKETKEYFEKRVNQKVLKLIKKKASFYEDLLKAEVGINKMDEYNGGDDKFEKLHLDKQIKYDSASNTCTNSVNLLSNIEKMAAKPKRSNKNNGYCDDEDEEEEDGDDNGIEFKPVPMAHRLSIDNSKKKSNNVLVKKESSNELDDTDLEKYTMKWDGKVNTLTTVFKKDPVLSFGDLNHFFENSQIGINSMYQQNNQYYNPQPPLIKSVVNGANMRDKISPIRDFSATVTNSNNVMKQSGGSQYNQNSGQQTSYSNSTKTLSDKEEQNNQIPVTNKSMFSNVKHAVYNHHNNNNNNNNNNSQNADGNKGKNESLQSPSTALLTRLSKNEPTSNKGGKNKDEQQFTKFDWTEPNNNNNNVNNNIIVPSMSVNNVGLMNNIRQYSNHMNLSKENLLDFGFDDINMNFFTEDGGNQNNTTNKKNGNAGMNEGNMNIETNNSFIFDGSMGLAQFLDMSYLNNNKRKNPDDGAVKQNNNKKLKK